MMNAQVVHTYVRRSLRNGHLIGNAFAQRLTQRMASNVLTIPQTVDMSAITEETLRSGGVASRETSIDELVHRVVHSLQKNERTFLAEDVLAKSTDPCMKRYEHMTVTVGHEVYFWLDVPDTEKIREAIRATAVSHHFTGFICADIPLDPSKGRAGAIKKSNGKQIANCVEQAFLGAFDGEGFIVLETAKASTG